MGSLPLNTVLHELPQHGSFPQAAVLHKLLQCPLHKVQSLRTRLLQYEFPSGSKALQANLLQHGLLSPQGHRSCQEPALVWALHGGTAPFRHPAYPGWDPPRAAVGPLLQSCLPWTAGGQPALPCFSHRLQGNLCSDTWSTSSPSYLTELGVSCSHFSLLFLKCSCAALLNPFLKMLSHQCRQWALLWPVVDPSCKHWHWLCLTRGKLLGSSHRSCLCSPADTKTLPYKPTATFSSSNQRRLLIHEMTASD